MISKRIILDTNLWIYFLISNNLGKIDKHILNGSENHGAKAQGAMCHPGPSAKADGNENWLLAVSRWHKLEGFIQRGWPGRFIQRPGNAQKVERD